MTQPPQSVNLRGAVPHFYVRIDGDLATDEMQSLDSLTIESSLHLPDMASLVLRDFTPLREQAQGYRFVDNEKGRFVNGKSLTITIKVGTHEEVNVFDGEIVEVEAQLSGHGQRLLVRHAFQHELAQKAAVAEKLVEIEQLVDDVLHAAHEQRPLWPAQVVELCPGHGCPATLAADAVHGERVGRKKLVGGLCSGFGHVEVAVERQRQGRRVVPGLLRRAAVEVSKWHVPGGFAPQNSNGKRQPQLPGPHGRGRRAAHPNPDGQLALQGARVHA